MPWDSTQVDPLATTNPSYGTAFFSTIHNMCYIQMIVGWFRTIFPTMSYAARLKFFLSMAQQPLVGQGLFITEASRSHSFRHTTLSRISLDEWSARRRDLYLTKHNTHKRLISMPPLGFEPAIPASERPQTDALDRAASGIGARLKLLT
jgi:hypothetical protein